MLNSSSYIVYIFILVSIYIKLLCSLRSYASEDLYIFEFEKHKAAICEDRCCLNKVIDIV